VHCRLSLFSAIWDCLNCIKALINSCLFCYLFSAFWGIN
jgi:hypothetical protein